MPKKCSILVTSLVSSQYLILHFSKQSSVGMQSALSESAVFFFTFVNDLQYLYQKFQFFFNFFLLNGFFALCLSIWKFLPSPSVELFKRGISQGATRSRGVLNSSKQDMPIFSLWVEPTKLNKVGEGVSSCCLWAPESFNLALAKTNHVSY